MQRPARRPLLTHMQLVAHPTCYAELFGPSTTLHSISRTILALLA
jgi:hypothetical protein